MENRNGLVVDGTVTLASGTAEREAARQMTHKLPEGATLGADKGYDAQAFVDDLKDRKIVPHVAINGSVSKTGKVRKTSVPPEVAASAGYEASIRVRKRIEEIFGWTKVTGGLAQLKVRGLDKVKAAFGFGLVAYNLIRLPKLLDPQANCVLWEGNNRI
jgi:IS5 family transposase